MDLDFKTELLQALQPYIGLRITPTTVTLVKNEISKMLPAALDYTVTTEDNGCLHIDFWYNNMNR